MVGELDIDYLMYVSMRPHGSINTDETFKSMDELQALYSSKGITPDKQIFPYCAIGGRSGYTWFILKYLLGYPSVRNYDGSWNQWSRISDAPVEK